MFNGSTWLPCGGVKWEAVRKGECARRGWNEKQFERAGARGGVETRSSKVILHTYHICEAWISVCIYKFYANVQWSSRSRSFLACNLERISSLCYCSFPVAQASCSAKEGKIHFLIFASFTENMSQYSIIWKNVYQDRKMN